MSPPCVIHAQAPLALESEKEFALRLAQLLAGSSDVFWRAAHELVDGSTVDLSTLKITGYAEVDIAAARAAE
eukprot:12783826-Alexandrium_andersonii.AAC.1